MNLLDICIIVIMVFLLIRGIFRGFFREICSLAGVILGIWLAILWHPQLTEYLKEYLPSGEFLSLISFALIFAAIFIACNLTGQAIKAALKKALFGWADKALGAGIAILKGIVITYFVIIMITFFVPSKTPLIAKSKLAPLIVRSYQSVAGFISSDPGKDWKTKVHGQKKKLDTVVSEKIDEFTGKDEPRQ
ncbi:MAG: CvpA family protein [Desulfobacterales bacterium]|nr:CvpA family protein [Desulfobacterales bacterium]